jgi:CheY-like chemotaxis protein
MDSTAVRARLLLVDDSEDFLRAESAWLGVQPGFEIVGTARSGETALEVVPRLYPDIVLIDLAMPGMGGFEAIRALKRLPSPPAVIAVSLHDSQVVRSEAAMAGADGFVPKARLSALLVPALHGVRCAARPTTEGTKPPAGADPQRTRLQGEPQAGAPPSPRSGSGHRDADAGAWTRLLAAVAARWSRAAWLRGRRTGAPAPVGD